MAFFAGLAEGSAMGVVATVTAVACRRRRHLVRDGLGAVAGVAIQVLMGSRQREIGLLVVVEAPEHPAIRVMAAVALRAELAGVMLVFVAGNACRWRIAECLGAMAFLARHRGMQADQRKARHVMIERDLLAPLHFVVAGLAPGTELPFVRIIRLVAGDAG